MSALISVAPPHDADVVVVGAGPAGCAAAIGLARGRRSVLLMDRARFPRDKVCGDFAGPRAVEELAALGVDDIVNDAAVHRIRRAAIHVNGAEVGTVALPEIPGLTPFGCVVPRMEFDAMLLARARDAGVQVCEGHAFQRFHCDDAGIDVEFATSGGSRRVRVRMLIGADGSASAVGRAVRGPARAADRIVAARAYFDGVRGDSERVDVYVESGSFPGYVWLFPTGERSANVGIGVLYDSVPRFEHHLRDLLGRAMRSEPMRARLSGAAMRGPIVGWPLATYNPRTPVTGERILLVGDAAGFINPINGEGIQYALASGRWAAESILASWDDAAMPARATAAYVDRTARELRRDLNASRLLVRLIAHRSFAPVWMHVVRALGAQAVRDPQYGAIFGGVLAGMLPSVDALSGASLRGAFRALSHVQARPRLNTVVPSLVRPFVQAMCHPRRLLRWMCACLAEGATVARALRL